MKTITFQGLKMTRISSSQWRMTLVLSVFLAISACGKNPDPPTITESQVLPPPMAVYPSILQGRESLELGNAILLLMPKPNIDIGWDWAVDSPIVWVDEGFQQEGNRAIRRGVVRVNVMGQSSTILRKKKDELGWSVELSTFSSPKFGPDEISIEAGLGAGGQCFGTLYDGCDFDPVQSLKNAGIDAKELCKDSDFDSNFNRIYSIVAPGKALSLLRWMRSSGSGGSSSQITLLLKTSPANVCKSLTK